MPAFVASIKDGADTTADCAKLRCTLMDYAATHSHVKQPLQLSMSVLQNMNVAILVLELLGGDLLCSVLHVNCVEMG